MYIIYVYTHIYIYTNNIGYIPILDVNSQILWRKKNKTFSLLEGSIPSCSQRPAGGRCCPSSWGFSSSSTIKHGDVMISLYVVYIYIYYIRSESLYFTMFIYIIIYIYIHSHSQSIQTYINQQSTWSNGDNMVRMISITWHKFG